MPESSEPVCSICGKSDYEKYGHIHAFGEFAKELVCERCRSRGIVRAAKLAHANDDCQEKFFDKIAQMKRER